MAIKTSGEIEADIYRIIRNSELANEITGSVMRKDVRPKNANTEDVVVLFKVGQDAQEQTGIVQIHVYVNDKDLFGDGELAADIGRIDRLKLVTLRTIEKLVSNESQTEYEFTERNTPTHYPVEGIHQHFINVELYYKRITF